MTFSIVGRSPSGDQVGVAVASYFLSIGAYVPAADPDAGALATQAYGSQSIKAKGLALMRNGSSPQQMLHEFLKADGNKDMRQIGVVAATGEAATFTGTDCLPWAGGIAAEDKKGSYTVQGNALSGEHVVRAMADEWLASVDETSLARRLVRALEAGEAAGGDPRGKMAAAVYVVGKNAGYGGESDVAVDLRADYSEEPVRDLYRMLDVHDDYFGKTPLEQFILLEGETAGQVSGYLWDLGYNDELEKSLWKWMGIENYEERWYKDFRNDPRIDPVVLSRLREKAESRRKMTS